MAQRPPSEEETFARPPSEAGTLAPAAVAPSSALDTLDAPTVSPKPAATPQRGAKQGESEDALRQARRALGGAAKVELGTGERYGFGELLGRGGMGEVWLVEDQRLERDVALKRIRPKGEPRPEDLARFLREAQLSGGLEHPNIVPIYDLGVDEEGALFFTMKRLRGRSLAQLLDAGELGSVHERLTIFRKVCDALAFAHARDVIHRDLKPDNVMVGEFGEVMVLDWGLAKRVGERTTAIPAPPPSAPTEDETAARAGDDSEAGTLTVDGALMGTPAFMAPEQALGHHHRIDTRTDIYALGILLYVLLTGERPFRGSVAAVLFQVSQGTFDRPSARAKVARELEAVVLKAMALEAEQRYASVAELNADIQAYLEGRPVSVLRYSWLQRAQKWAGRNRSTVTAATATGAVGLAVLIAGGAMYLRDLAAARDRAEHARDEATRARDGATAARDEAQAARDRALEAEREAQIRTGEAQVGLALARARGGEFGDASALLAEARSSFEQASSSPLAVDLVHAWVDGHSPPPLARYELAAGADVGGLSRDRHRIAWYAGERVVVDDWLLGRRLVDKRVPGLVERGVTIHEDEALALVRGEGQVEVRSLADDELRATLPEATFHWLCADGEHILIGDREGQLQRWSVSSGEPRGVSFGCGRMLTASGDCGRISCDAERRPPQVRAERIQIWDTLAGRKLHDLPGGNTKNIAFDGTLMVQSFEHQGIQLWDLDRGTMLWEDRSDARTGSGYFSPDGQRIYAQTAKHRLHEWTRAGEWLGERALGGQLLAEPVADPYLLTFSEDSFAVYTSGAGAHAPIDAPIERVSSGAVGLGELVQVLVGKPHLLVDPLTGAVLDELGSGGRKDRMSVDFDARGRALIASSGGGLAHFDLTRSSAPLAELELEADGARLTAARLWPGREAALVADSEGRLHVWDFEAGAVVARHETGQYIWELELDPAGRRAYVSGRLPSGGAVSVVELETGAKLFESPTPRSGYGLALGQREGQVMFAVGTQRGSVEVWAERDTSEALAVLREVPVPLMSLAFSPDSELLIAHTYTGELVLWQTRDWHVLPILPVELPRVRVSADGRRLLSAIRTFDLDLAERSEAVRLGFPAAAGEGSGARMTKAIAGLALQKAWAGADDLIEGARADGLPVDELLAARVAWKLGDADRALAALERVEAASVANPAELAVWLRIVRAAVGSEPSSRN